MKNKYILVITIVIIICSALLILFFPKNDSNIINKSGTEKVSAENIKNLISNTEQMNRFVKVNGKTIAVGTKAAMDLRDIGEPVIPFLIEELKTDGSIMTKRVALSIIYELNEKNNDNLMKYLPVFVTALKDKEPDVRRVAVALIGQMAERFKYYNINQKYFDRVMPYLIDTMNDTDKYVKATTGEFLFEFDRKDLVPEEIVKEFEIGEKHK